MNIEMKNIFLCFFMIFSIPATSVTIHQGTIDLKKTIKSWIELKNTNLVRQKYDYSCGSASLSTILTYFYNLKISEKDVLDTILKLKGLNCKKKEQLENKDLSLSFSDLVKFPNKKEFKAFGLALDLQSLKKLKIPVLLFVKIRKNEHFTVYKNMDDQFVYLADPNFGNLKVKITKFKEMFYQREDLKYPGKILAIIPKKKRIRNKINKNFIKIFNNKNIYEIIKNNIRRKY